VFKQYSCCIFDPTNKNTENMKTFTILNKVVTYNNKQNNKSVEIVKVIKDGTKRTFFACMSEGKYVTTTMFARQYDANRVAKQYCNA
jgi:hypothetical protein